MNEKDTMDEIGNMDVFGHMDGMTFMDEIDQDPYILIWLTWPNVTILSDQIYQLNFFHPCTQVSSMPFKLILSIFYVSVTHVVGPIHPKKKFPIFLH